jgi:hypothetical protein
MTTSKPTGKATKLPTVAEYLTAQIAVCGRDQVDIAKDLDYPKPNMISMLKTGATKLPLNKVGPMAKAIGVDPAFLFRVVMKEYLPDSYDSIVAIMGTRPVSDNEYEILQTIRKVNGGDPAIPNQEMRDELRKWAAKLPAVVVPNFRREK